MNQTSKRNSNKIYIGIIILLSLMAAINVFLPQGDLPNTIQNQELPASKPILAIINAATMLLLYGGLGYLGIILSRKLGFTDIISNLVTHKQRLLTPAIVGATFGVFFVLTDIIFSNFHSFGKLPHPPFPTSIVASLTAGISEEIIFRLFFISFWVWLISYVLLKNRFLNTFFWIFTGLSAIAFTISHIPSIMLVYGLKSINEIPFPLLLELFILNGSLSIVAAYYFKRYGILAAITIHFWADIVWHVIWGIAN